jgi:hypothetical protein
MGVQRRWNNFIFNYFYFKSLSAFDHFPPSFGLVAAFL